MRFSLPAFCTRPGLLAPALLLASILGLQGCASSTQGGAVGIERSQFFMLSSAQVNAQAAQGFSQMTANAVKEKKLNTDRRLTERVRLIGTALIAQVGAFRPDARQWPWEINVFESDELNAFCMPGGKIGVYSGIVTRLQLTDDELAAIMGHEIAHALREHSREKLSKQGLSNILVGVASAASGVDSSLLGSGANLFMHLPNSRAMELEADIIGLELMARAGYDPRNAPKVWEKMMTVGGKQGSSFFSTHPLGEERIAEMQTYIPKVMPVYEAALARNPRPASASGR